MSITLTARAIVTTGGIDQLLGMAVRIEAVISDFAQRIHDEAQRLAPVESGGLRDSIKVELQVMAATISAGEGLPDWRAGWMEYGFHHHGSGTWVQRPYLVPALLQFRDSFIEAIRAAIAGV